MDWFEQFCLVCLMIIGLFEVGLGIAHIDYGLCVIGGITIGYGIVRMMNMNND